MVSPIHYLKSALTNFKRNKGYTSLMVFSLAAGMFCFVLAQLYVNYEFSRNKNHKHADLVYQIKLRFGNEGRHSYPPLKYVEALKSIFPNIEAVSMLDRGRDEYLSVDNLNFFKETNPFYANQDFFNTYTFPLKYGNVENALSDPKNIVLSERLSDLMFPGIDPVGKEVYLNEKGVFRVGGVLEKVSKLSVMNPGLLFTREQRFKERPRTERTGVLFTHIKLKSDEPQDQLEVKLYDAFRSMVDDPKITGIYSEKLKDAYWGGTHHNYGTDYYSLMGTDKQMVNAMVYIGIAVLVCAFVGYLSLYISMSLRRSKEIGIRKVNGAVQSDIRIQILTESVFYAFIALLLTVVSLELTSAYFSDLFQVPIDLNLLQPRSVLLLIVFTFLTGLMAGIYPAFVVAKMNPVRVLSGEGFGLGKSFNLKRALIVLQLVVSSVLVFSVLTLQMNFYKLNQFEVGYNTKDLISFQVGAKNINNNYLAVRDEISKIPGVSEVSGGPFPFNTNGYLDVSYAGADTLWTDEIPTAYIANNFFATLRIGLNKGEDLLSIEKGQLDQVCAVNETFARNFGENMLGQSILVNGQLRRIIVVYNDYSLWGLGQPETEPQVFIPVTEPKFHSLIFKVDPKKKVEAKTSLEGIWKSYEAVLEPEIVDLDDSENELIESQAKINTLFGFLATTVILLSLVNLMGVSLVYARSKLKNICIRRILGADTIELFSKLVRPFVFALIISLVIALPIAYILMESYLMDFPVRIELGIEQGVLLFLIMMFSIFSVIGLPMLKSSKVDPISVLKED